jgi:tRNA threonylcarbamoyladenosine biosynthesis protein TsaE
MVEWTFELENIHIVAAAFWKQFDTRKVFALHGQMGSGKTTFVHALCDVKKVSSPVGSPTFSLINEYRYPGGTIFHIDLYRLKDEEEAERAGVEDALYSGNTCFVEWPERIPDLFPEDSLQVYIEAINGQTRRVWVDNK